MWRVADRVLEAQRLAQRGLAFSQRQGTQIGALVAQEVEHVEVDRHTLLATALEALEARDAAAVERDHLAIDDEVAGRLRLECSHQLRVAAAHVAVGPRQQADP